MLRDISFDDQFYSVYFMWDSFMAGVAISIMSTPNNPNGENQFAEMEYMNITIHTSNKPYGVLDGSNPFFDGFKTPKFQLKKHGVHSGHVLMYKGHFEILSALLRMKKEDDGYTEEVTGYDSVRVLVATRAKPNKDPKSSLDREFFIKFLDVLNHPTQSGRFNLTTQFPHYKEVIYTPNHNDKKLGKPLIFDMHMMGRDDIQVGLGEIFAKNQSDIFFSSVRDCKYVKAIPHGNGGFLDSDTLYGLARDLPHSPRKYTAENSVKLGGPHDTDHPELRQPLALEIWRNVTKTIDERTKITILTNGPLTTLSKVLSLDKNAVPKIKDVFVLGGHLNVNGTSGKGNVFTVPTNKYAEFNMFLDPLSVKMVIESKLPITLIPLGPQRQVSSMSSFLNRLSKRKNTPEALFIHRLVSKLSNLQKHYRYHHVGMFMGEILGAVVLADIHLSINSSFQVKPIKVIANGNVDTDGQMVINAKDGRSVRILERFDVIKYYDTFVNLIGNKKQSAMVGSFSEQRRIWWEAFQNKEILFSIQFG